MKAIVFLIGFSTVFSSGCFGSFILDNSALTSSVGFLVSNGSFSPQEKTESNIVETSSYTEHHTEIEKEDIFLRITSHLKSQNATSGDDIQFKCKVSGKPKHIRFTWYHNDMKIVTTSGRHAHLSVSNHVWGSKLKIRGVYTLDSGLYRCEASNGLRRVHTSAYLTISFQRPPPASKQQPITLPRGECQRYRGLVCSGYFNGSAVFVDPDASQEEIEEHIQSALQEIAKSKYISKKCRSYTVPAFCNFIFPPCSIKNGKAQPKKLCREECELLKKEICYDEYEKRDNNPLLKYIFDNVDCHNLPSAKSNKCTGVGLINFNQKSKRNNSECFTENGETYKGTVAQTDNGKTCTKWPEKLVNQYPDLAEHQFCRNPGGLMDKPWCFTDDAKEEKSYCNITLCVEIKETVPLLFIILSCLGGVLSVVAFVCAYFYCYRGGNKKGLSETSSDSILLQPEMPYFSPQLMIPQLNASSIQLLTELGKWDFGTAYKGAILNDPRFPSGQSVSVKVLNKESPSSAFDQFISDLEILSNLKHSNLAVLKAAVLQTGFRCTIHEYTDQVDLHEYLVLNRASGSSTQKGHTSSSSQCQLPPDNLDFIEMALQITSGMEYLSNNNYIHRDLAARNVLVCGNMKLKISNLGVVRDSYLPCYFKSSNGKLMPVRWMAPESFHRWQFSDKSTVWSFGVLLWEIFSYGMQPYCGYSNHEVLDVISRRQLLSCPDQCPAKMYSLMHECWAEIADQRPTFKDIQVKLRSMMEGGDVVILAREEAQRRGPPPEYSSRPPSLQGGNCSHSQSECSYPSFASTGSNIVRSLMGNNDTSPNTSFSPYFSEDESDARSEPRGRVLHI